MAQQNEKPIKSFRSGNIQIGIWRKEVQEDGQTKVRHSIRIKKQFRKEDGNYQDTDYYFPEELPRLLACVQRAFEYVAVTESEDTVEAEPI